MSVANNRWIAIAAVAALAACDGPVIVGVQKASAVGVGNPPSAMAPVNQVPVVPLPPAEPPADPVQGTPPPSCPVTTQPRFVAAPVNWFPNGPDIFSLAYSPDGRTIAAGGEALQPNVRLWNTADLSVLRDVAGHGQPTHGVTYAVAFSPDSQILATAGIEAVDLSSNSKPGGEMVKLWDVASGSLLRVIPATSGFYSMAVAFSHDGTLLATSGAFGPIEIWRVSDGALMTSIPYPTTVYGVTFSPDDTGLLTAGFDHVATLWRVADGAKLLTLIGDAGEITDAAYSPDGSEIATGSHDYTVRRWDAVSGAPLETLTGHSRYISRVKWIDQNHLASNDWLGTVILWTRDASGNFTDSCSLSTQRQSVGMDVSPDRTKLIASGADGQTPGFWIFPL
jgi:WD40 repeat protein